MELTRSIHVIIGEVCAALLLAPAAALSETVRVRSCYDGDTCRTSNGEKIRLACIDAPELKGKRADPIPARASRDFLNNMIKGQQVEIQRITTDRYGRTVAQLIQQGRNVSEELVATGHAKIYWKHAKPCPWTGHR